MKRKTTKIALLMVCLGLGSFYGGMLMGESSALKEISKDDIAHAENLLALSFTDAQRDSMLDGLHENREAYLTLRSQEIDNSVSPALVFNPLPEGYKMPEGKPVFKRTVKKVDLPSDSTDLAFFGVAALSQLIEKKKITSAYLTRFYLDRLKAYGPELECTVTLMEDYAMDRARQADKEIAAGKYKGPLHGIPFGAKDLLAKKDFPTTWGAVPYQDQEIDEDAEVITRLEASGAILVAKLTLGALAWGDVWFGGKTRNPWNTDKGSSGSSAGSASAVAAGLVPFAIGSETLGSIVSPASTCGVTGLRPTYGAVPKTGAMALSWSMDKLGPLAGSAEDCAIVYNAIYGPDGVDKSVRAHAFQYDDSRDVKQLKVGYLVDDFDNALFKELDEAALKTFEAMGVRLQPKQLPDMPVRDLLFILSAEGAAAFDELTLSGKDSLLVRQVKNAWPNVFRQSRFIPAVEYIQANRMRSMLIEAMDEVMSDIDVLIAPSFAGSALALTNLTGQPCVVMPNGFGKDGLPGSFTIISNLYREGDALILAKAYQERTDFNQRKPPGF